MKIVVIGGSGLIGTQVVAKLRQRGHEVVAASFSPGVNIVTGEGLAGAIAAGNTIHLPPALYQPVASVDVADALADIALAAPVNGTIEIAGPDALPFDGAVRQFPRATQDERQVIADANASYFGLPVTDRSLAPDDSPRIGSTRFHAWLTQSFASGSASSAVAH